MTPHSDFGDSDFQRFASMADRRVARSPIADYYEAKRQEAQEIADTLRQARADGTPLEVIRALERRLDAALYVGD